MSSKGADLHPGTDWVCQRTAVDCSWSSIVYLASPALFIIHTPADEIIPSFHKTVKEIKNSIYLGFVKEDRGLLTNSLKWKYSTETKLCGKAESIFTNFSSTVTLHCNFQCNLWYQMHFQESWELSVQVYLAVSLRVGGEGKRPLNSCKITITASIFALRKFSQSSEKRQVLGSWMANGQLLLELSLQTLTLWGAWAQEKALCFP